MFYTPDWLEYEDINGSFVYPLYQTTEYGYYYNGGYGFNIGFDNAGGDVYLGLNYIYETNPVISVNESEITKPDDILFIGSPGPYYTVARGLKKEGFIINIGEGFPYSTPLTWNQIKYYNVIVLTGIGLGQSNADFSLTQTNKKNISVLNFEPFKGKTRRVTLTSA